MIKFYKLLFFNSMIIGTLISISAYSWMSMWLGLEINLLAILPMMKMMKNYFSAESIMKYFITQALASMILLLSIILTSNLLEYMNFMQNMNMLIMNSAFLMKLGMIPFHFWLPEVIEGLNWNMSLIVLTWQKIAPFILISYNIKFNFLFFYIIIFSSLVSGILGLNQLSLRKILTFSSINHMSWMLATLFYSNYLWLIYFLIYSFLSINIILMFNYFNIFFLSQMFIIMNNKKMSKMMFMSSFLSMGGLPPFLGFLPKWLTINYLIEQKFFIMIIILVITTLVSLFYYMRITLPTMIISNNENLLFSKKNKFMYMLINFSLMSSLIFYPMMILL